MSNAFSLAPLFRHSVGFDRFNDLFESALRNEAGSTYRPTTSKSTVTTSIASSSPPPASRKKTWTCRSSAAC